LSNAYRLIVRPAITTSAAIGMIALSWSICAVSSKAQSPAQPPVAPPAQPPAALPAQPPLAPLSPPVTGAIPEQTPTDQAPTEYPIPQPLALGSNLTVRGALDTRMQSQNDNFKDVFINETEVEADQRIVTDGKTNGKIVLQIIGQRDPDDHGNAQVQVGDAYLLYKLPIETDTKSTAYITVGQFQIPFGLLAVYDPHLLIQQPLYAEAIGIRNDWGAKVSGRFDGLINYDLSYTSGAGANHSETDGSRLVTFRLGRTFNSKLGAFNVGGSILQGRLPNTDLTKDNPFAEDLPPAGNVQFQEGVPLVDKTRIAVDGTYIYRSIQARAEAMIGADDSSRVTGYYGEGEYHLSSRTGAILSSTYWKYPGEDSYFEDYSFGYSYTPQSNLIFRALYSLQHDVPVGLGGTRTNVLTLQALLRF